MDKKGKTKIAIFGAGAIGSLIGGFLAQKNEDVTLIGSKKHIDSIKKNGLLVEGIKGNFNVKISVAEKLEFKPDIIFLTVKTHDVPKACEEIKPFAKNIPVVLMQNGISCAKIADSILENAITVSSVVMLNARFLSPGKVSYISDKPIVLGKADIDEEIFIKIENLLSHISVVIVSKNIAGAQWAKLFVNAMSNALDAMTGLCPDEYIKHPGVLKIGVGILREALNIVEKAEIKLEALPGIPLTFFKLMIKLPTPLAAFFLGRALTAKENGEIITSTLQSLRRGKKTEIDFLNGEIVKLGNEIGISSPYNSKVVELIHKIEKNNSFFSPERLSAEFTF